MNFLPLKSAPVQLAVLLAAMAVLGGHAFAASLSVRDFGATGDGKTSDTAAIQRALDTAAGGGGGEVLLPAGRYLTGSLLLKSGTVLRLETNATLFGSPRPDDYPLIRMRWEGIETNCHRALLAADHAENITITGAGVIEGNPAVGRLRNPRGPSVIEADSCTDFSVTGVTLKSTRMWTLHPVYCRAVRIAGVVFETTGANSDGIDPDSCQGVLIDGCTFTTGDDNIAIKSGKGQEGVRIGRPCEDLTITNCTFLKGYTSIAFGSELSGGIRRVRISHCTFRQGRAALQFKSREGRAGFLEEITAEDLTVGPEPLLEITGTYAYNPDPQGVPCPAGFTRFRNIRITGVTITATNLLTVSGAAVQPVDGLRLADVSGTCRRGSVLQNATNVVFRNIHLTGLTGPMFYTNNFSGAGLDSAVPLSERPAR